ncbi:isoleucine--tRNA ligase [Halocatena salina]|uniref:Isoleucine--tRNA ligase n=1 Tax=Halocatena salina TaxID=2934340 RepID=A0A8U0A2K5_9EURY|nr:isoleucine--tRNA ligase [Halocatena salina]UPM43380.1 isoleucine--tRNA ligase [Halocatena salina]
MSRFEEIDDRYDPHAVERETAEYWDAVDAYEQTKAHRDGEQPYFFVDGPPYTSGSAHMGTTWNKTLKDCYIRYLRMSGYDVTDRPGYDMHGLPIETRVEERLGFENKKDIEAFGEQRFIEECKSFADEQLDGLQEDFQSFGVWMDWENPYKTVSSEYMESTWWGFKQAHERELVEQGQRSISQCPRCETAIANNEVEYEVVDDPSIYVKFPLTEREGSLVIWTTTPWTIPANTFVAIDGDATYQAVRAETDGGTETLYLEASCVEAVLDRGGYDGYEVIESFDGEELVGWTYEHPLDEEVPDHPEGEDALQVYTGDYVEIDRTGLVHSAPGHGEEDFERGQELGLPVVCPVGPDGVFTERAGAYAGQFVKDADTEIMADLDRKGLLLAEGTVSHDYGHCWRCDTGIIQIVTDQWFITVSEIKDELLENIEDSEWYPQSARDNRFKDFVQASPDWNVSRQRYWGVPIPIWTPEEWSGKMDEVIVVGTREELADRVDQAIDPETVDLHKDTVDELTITEDGRTYTRISDVFDVWIDSAVATWGTLDYPHNEAAFEELWPADLIIEAHDQTRGWFWSQLGMGTAALGEVPYEQVLMHGWALMPDGRAMSKSKDILIDPHEVIDEYGTDPMRAFLLSFTARAEDMKFSWDEVAEMKRRLNILWNVFRFSLQYMRPDGFDPEQVSVADAQTEVVDEWVLSRLQTVEAEMAEHFEAFEQDKAFNRLIEFVVEDVSRFYVQEIRDRVWPEADSPSKTAAYATLYTVLEETVALLAPFAPFVADTLYQHLTGDTEYDTVHMCDWPEPADQWRDRTLEADIEIVRAVEEAGSNARQKAERSLRWPVERIVVAAETETTVTAVDRRRDLIKNRLNAQEIQLVEPGEQWGELRYAAEADMSVLGPTFGDDAGQIMNALNDASVTEPTVEALETAVSETYEPVSLTEEMVEIVTKTPADVTGTAFDTNGEQSGVVYVDTSLTPEIRNEGYAREVTRRVNEMRSDLELDNSQRIQLDITVDDERIAQHITERSELIREEVRAETIGTVEDGYRKEWEITNVDNDTPVALTLTIEPVAPQKAST